MKKLLIAAFAAQALLFTACGDDSSSGGISMSMSGSITVDEANQLLVLIPDAYSEAGCVLEGETPVWKSVVHLQKPDSFKYEFRGDTLLLHEVDGEYVYDGRMFVGGKAGNLYASWRYTSCRYDEEDAETQCSEKDAKYYELVYKLSPGRVNAKAVYYYDKYLADEGTASYMDSYFMYQLYGKLSVAYGQDVYIDEITYNKPEIVQGAIVNYGVQVLERNDKGGKFTIGEKTYTVRVNKVEERLVTTEHDGTEEMEINIEVSDGVTTCVAEYFRLMPQRNLCKAENMDYLNFETEYDGNGLPYQYAYRFRMENENAFNSCLYDISAGKQLDGFTPLYKKAEEPRHDSESDTFRMYRKMLKYANN